MAVNLHLGSRLTSSSKAAYGKAAVKGAAAEVRACQSVKKIGGRPEQKKGGGQGHLFCCKRPPSLLFVDSEERGKGQVQKDGAVHRHSQVAVIAVDAKFNREHKSRAPWGVPHGSILPQNGTLKLSLANMKARVASDRVVQNWIFQGHLNEMAAWASFPYPVSRHDKIFSVSKRAAISLFLGFSGKAAQNNTQFRLGGNDDVLIWFNRVKHDMNKYQI